MVEYDRTQERDAVASAPLKICVAGIGGAGLNVLDRITLDRIVDATLVSMHTDVRVLSHAMTPHKIQLGAEQMRGIGSGGDPELGREAAIASRETIKAIVQGHDMVFLCAGLGGGTASGATPVVAEIAKECGALVFVFATMPFSFEGRRRLVQAEIALEEVQKYADALILFENNRMGELTLPKEGIQKAFSQADQLIGHSVRAIATMVTRPGIIQLGLSDLMTALRSPNTRCLFGFGEGKGSNRVTDALKRALKSPLVNQGQLLAQARNLLVHVAGGESLTLAEVETLMKQLGKCVPDQTQILFGVSTTPALGDSLAVTLISSLSAQQMLADPPTAVNLETIISPPVVTRRAAAVAPAPVPAPAPAQAAPEPEPAPVVAKQPAPMPVPVAPPLESILPQLRDELELPIMLHSNGHAPTPPAPAPEPAPVVAEAPRPAPVKAPREPVAKKAEPAPVPAPAPVAAPAPLSEAKAPTPPVERSVPETQGMETHAAAQRAAAEAEASAIGEEESIFELDESDEEDGGFENEVEEEPVVAEEHVVSLPVRIATAPAKVQQPDPEPRVRQPKPVAHPEPAMAGAAAKGTPGAQPSLNLHQEEVTRFKGTEKTIVEGEDLDVPTWMRMKQRTR